MPDRIDLNAGRIEWLLALTGVAGYPIYHTPYQAVWATATLALRRTNERAPLIRNGVATGDRAGLEMRYVRMAEAGEFASDVWWREHGGFGTEVAK